MDEVRTVVSGGASAEQFQDAMKAMPKAQLLEMFHDLGLDQVRIPYGHLLAAKVDCGFNYNQIRKLRRWLKKYGVTVESESIKAGGKEPTLQSMPSSYPSLLRPPMAQR
ncbi:PREDICTED: uncharacterized protein LOC109478638 [Branchiostoma belcheri]|uniref:Uncharacterized protein LOC109478638 n=1 Tax=Branchiostoma belcheri TaxID=7741 RepID=A0A6P4Z2V6_BRABE|nr:PREDICTED: uncharacterized protein LOC109478638 [Branchiostoma belcheri]